MNQERFLFQQQFPKQQILHLVHVPVMIPGTSYIERKQCPKKRGKKVQAKTGWIVLVSSGYFWCTSLINKVLFA
jgi:hypothetical protein